ncbi:MAG: hypothetical protein RJA20_2715, partial [Bacteroidota bacterium]
MIIQASLENLRLDFGKSMPIINCTNIHMNPAQASDCHVIPGVSAGRRAGRQEIIMPASTETMAAHWYRRSPAITGVWGSPRKASSTNRP